MHCYITQFYLPVYISYVIHPQLEYKPCLPLLLAATRQRPLAGTYFSSRWGLWVEHSPVKVVKYDVYTSVNFGAF